jgi:DNA polymerase I-like protein with 3'-5' exonuclease and polymerase domains
MRIHPRYWIPGAATGRWACSNPNLQQVSKKLRRLYRADPGQCFVGADFKSLELYTLAHTMHCLGIEGPLMETLREGGDIHSRTADLMGETGEKARFNAKMANFGLAGGMGNKTFLRHARAQGAEWEEADARRVSDAWFRAYPDARAFLELFRVYDPWFHRPEDRSASEWLEDLGFDPEEESWPRRFDLTKRLNGGAVYTVVLPSGRRIPQRHYSAGANALFQGPGADVITHAFVECVAAGLEPVAVVHDAVVVTCPLEDSEETGRALVEVMGGALHKVCPSVPCPLPEFSVSEVLT